jgi:hypothetical protein
MFIIFEDRPADSPFVERIWRSHSERAGTFISMAMSHWQMVVTRLHGQISLTVRGPETKATPAYCPENGEWVGILFKLGAWMPSLPAGCLVDKHTTLPEAAGKSFWLNGSAWQFPDYENAETFVDRLVRGGLLLREPVVDAAVHGQQEDLSLRSIQRRFLHATGLTHSAARQIERARYATLLLRQGVSILDAVDLAGYFDQPHLTRSPKYFSGQTPAQLNARSSSEQLSYLYKTEPFG